MAAKRVVRLLLPKCAFLAPTFSSSVGPSQHDYAPMHQQNIVSNSLDRMRWFVAVLATCISVAHDARGQVSLGTLSQELANRDSLAVHPKGAYTLHQASSHDTRNSKGYSRLGAPWGFANVDFGNFLRQAEIDGRSEWVMMEDTGPGVVTRWWTTGIDQGLLDNNRVRIYIDGATTPAIEATAEELVGGDNLGFGPGLNFETPEKGGNLYGPIPYQDSILVTWDGPSTHDHAHVALRDPGADNSVANALWYNINYRKLLGGTQVDSYDSNDLARHRDALDRANEVLASPPVSGSSSQEHQDWQELADGQLIEHSIQGPGAIRKLQVALSGDDLALALDEVELVLVFDGEVTARVPVGQFFGNGWSENSKNPYNEGGDYMRNVAADGRMTSYWVMPFERSAEIRLQNHSGSPVRVELEIDSGDWRWSDDSMHFHADYVSEEGIHTRTAEGGPWPGNAGKRELYSHEGDLDFRFLSVRGRGVFVGDTMSVRNLSTGPGLNSWWGEGDEKIYVDYLSDESDGSAATPDHVGIGTEDYYGYSFGSGKEFTSPFVTQPNAAGNRADNRALTVNGRVRGLDAIPFDHSFKFDMEVWKWKRGVLDISAATFWYGVPGATSLHVVANLAKDYELGDTAGDGRWSYFACGDVDPSVPQSQRNMLKQGTVGDLGNIGYGGGQNGTANLPAISNRSLFETGKLQNLGIDGDPGYHELAVHPGDGCSGSDAESPFVVARWTAGSSSSGLINVAGAVRNLVANGDSIDFHIYVGGRLAFESRGNGNEDGKLPETSFDFDAHVETGEHVDFVVGNGGNGDLAGDETLLRVLIRSAQGAGQTNAR